VKGAPFTFRLDEALYDKSLRRKVMRIYRGFEVLVLTIFCSLVAFPAHAAAINPGTAGAPLGIALAIAYVTRRMSIGGWLFYYYFQLYATLLISLLLGALVVENLNLSGWEDKALYMLFVISTVPIYLMKIVETLFATRLLIKSQRKSKNVKTLRYILSASVVFYAISLTIDHYHFPDNVALDVFGLVFAFIWALYFFVSYRVNYVLSNWSGKWDYKTFKLRGTNKEASPQNTDA
jgi:hypothetical protein